MEPQSRQLEPQSAGWVREPLALPAEKLRVLLDARKLGHGGIGTYIENLIAGFLELGVELTVIGSRSALLRFGLLDYVGILADETRPYSLSEMLQLGRRIDSKSFDIFHSPHFTLPLGIRIPSVVTVHDLIHIHHPEHFYYPWLAKPLIRSALKRATRVITVSESSRRDLVELMCADRNFDQKLSVISNAVDPIFSVSANSSRARRENPYFFAVMSNSKPHKGLSDLLEAFSRLTSDGALPAGCKLVLAGEGAARIADVHRLVTPVGRVSKEKLARLYREAMATIIPSRAEGFCLPALESHACGTPVISTPVPAVEELLGEQDVVCPGFSADDISNGIRAFLEQARLRKERSAKASPDCSERFSRREIARRTLDIYHAAFDGAGA